LIDLPFSLYSTFVIEAWHGFNKQTIWLFLRDMVAGLGLSVLLGPPIVAAIIIIVQLMAFIIICDIPNACSLQYRYISLVVQSYFGQVLFYYMTGSSLLISALLTSSNYVDSMTLLSLILGFLCIIQHRFHSLQFI